jgi:hypothetical protein
MMRQVEISDTYFHGKVPPRNVRLHLRQLEMELCSLLRTLSSVHTEHANKLDFADVRQRLRALDHAREVPLS